MPGLPASSVFLYFSALSFQPPTPLMSHSLPDAPHGRTSHGITARDMASPHASASSETPSSASYAPNYEPPMLTLLGTLPKSTGMPMSPTNAPPLPGGNPV